MECLLYDPIWRDFALQSRLSQASAQKRWGNREKRKPFSNHVFTNCEPVQLHYGTSQFSRRKSSRNGDERR
jgi:hypothetical protein